ncbi:MAG: hypothetical protein NT027_07460 [Proteobacteria bacterium]|nr:hypothetical protein [Pseudomonadota bacterium]
MFNQSNNSLRASGRIKRPIYAFMRCPHCGSNRVNAMRDDHNVFCGDCNWDSLNVYAELQAKASSLRNLSNAMQ